MKRLTMSKTQLVRHCLAWLRDDAEWAWDEPGLPAQEGTYVHSLIEISGTDAHLKPVPPDGIDTEKCTRMYKCWTDWFAANGPRSIQHEVALAYDPETGVGRELRPEYHRDYRNVRKGEIGGSLDAITYDEGALHVFDWKTGKPVAPAKSNMQLAAGMLAARGLYPDATSYHVHLIYLNDEGRPAYVDSAELDEMDLDAARAELRDALRNHGLAKPVPGAHCTALYCPARGTCPATVAAMVELSGVTAQSVEAMVSRSIKTPDDVRRVWPLLLRADELLKAAKDKVKTIVELAGPVDLGETVLRITEPTKRETFSKNRIPEAKRDEVLADLRAMGAVGESTSKGFLREGKQ